MGDKTGRGFMIGTTDTFFERAAVKGGRERHIGFAGFGTEDSQHLDKVGICGRIEDDEAGVDGDLGTVERNGDSVRMPADPTGFLVDRDLVAGVEEPCRAEARDACPDDGDA